MKNPATPRRVRRSDGEEFSSIKEAAQATNCRASEISAVAQGDRGRKRCGGYGWEYIEDTTEANVESPAFAV